MQPIFTPVRNFGFLRLATLLLLVFCTVVQAEQATSVSQWGSTWTFDKPHTVGKFVTGDWLVVSPVTVVKVDPEPKGGRNGSMINPKSCLDFDFKHALDDRFGAIVSAATATRIYDPKLCARYPLAPEQAAQIKPIAYNPWLCDFVKIMWQTYRDKADKIGEETKAKWNQTVGEK